MWLVKEYVSNPAKAAGQKTSSNKGWCEGMMP